MIKHYFCEYCGKDFLSEDECLNHEKNCEIKKNNELKKKIEAEKKADMDKIMSSFADTAKLCKDYMERYDIFDIDKFSNTLRDRLSEIEDKIFEGFEDFVDFNSEPTTDLKPVKFTLSDVKFDKDELDKLLGKTEPQEIKAKINNTDFKKSTDNKSDDEIDTIINKLSNPSFVVEHDEENPEDAVTYYFNGKPVTEKEFIFHCMDMMPSDRREKFKKDIGWNDDEENEYLLYRRFR